MKDYHSVQAWVERLRKMLVDKAYNQFEAKTVSKETFTTFLAETTFVPDWDSSFIDKTYLEYLEKINETGAEMTARVNDKGLNEKGG
jgi:hypothetical protein